MLSWASPLVLWPSSDRHRRLMGFARCQEDLPEKKTQKMIDLEKDLQFYTRNKYWSNDS